VSVVSKEVIVLQSLEYGGNNVIQKIRT